MAKKERSPEKMERRSKIRELLQTSNISGMENIQNLFREIIAGFMVNDLTQNWMRICFIDYKPDSILSVKETSKGNPVKPAGHADPQSM